MQIWLAAANRDVSDLLSDSERRRAADMGVEGRRQFVSGRHLLRSSLGAALGIEPADISLSQSGAGRVSLTDIEAGPGFSVSHTSVAGRAWVAVVINPLGAVGVDIENPSRGLDMVRTATRRYSPFDRDQVLSARTPDRAQRFFSLWTLKEASVKLIDGSLLPVLRGTAFDLAGASPHLIHTDIAALRSAVFTSAWIADAGLILSTAAYRHTMPGYKLDVGKGFAPCTPMRLAATHKSPL